MKRNDHWEMMYLSYKKQVAKVPLSEQEKAKLQLLSKQASNAKVKRNKR